MEFRGLDPFACGISNPTLIDQTRVGTSGFRRPMRALVPRTRGPGSRRSRLRVLRTVERSSVDFHWTLRSVQPAGKRRSCLERLKYLTSDSSA
jgi:hypothetical protein